MNINSSSLGSKCSEIRINKSVNSNKLFAARLFLLNLWEKKKKKNNRIIHKTRDFFFRRGGAYNFEEGARTNVYIVSKG